MKRILIVDDSQTVIMSIKNSLEILGYYVESAACGEFALSILADSIKFDLIITDLNMPGMTGIELIKKIRQSSTYRFTPILLLTTENGTGGKKDEAKAAGATGWLMKPVSSADLDKTLKQLIR